MQVLNIGSINVDHVYAVAHFVQPGETLASASYRMFAGGKGFNQSIALARAGATTRHAGKIGKDGTWLRQQLQDEGVDVTHLDLADGATGHAVIQVIPSGENAIILHGGANLAVRESDLTHALTSCGPGDYLLLQNETSAVAEAIRGGHARGLTVVLNPAPMNAAVRGYPLDLVDLFILNETEAAGLTGAETPAGVCAAMRSLFPGAATVLTLGRGGAAYFDASVMLRQPAVSVTAVDTTAAGDTFIGYFLAARLQGRGVAEALALGCRAAAVCVTREGASPSIPLWREVEGH